MKIRSLLFTVMLLATALTLNAQTNELFRANEFSVRLGILNLADLGHNDVFDRQAKSLAGFEAGMGYYISRWGGLEVNVPVWKSDNRCFQSVSAGGMFRLPMDMVLKGDIWRHIAPYGRFGLGYGECYTAPYSGYVGGGLEVRLTRVFSLFGGVLWSQRGIFESDSFGVIRSECGARLSFDFK